MTYFVVLPTPLVVAVWYLMASALSFVLYARDKSAAKRRARRTRELALHLVDLAGGWPGGWIAQRLLRHKTAKPTYRLVFWATAILNIAMLCGLLMAAY